MEPSPLAAATEPPRPPAASAEGGAAALSVAQVVARIRGCIERQFPAPLWVEGELSNCTYHASGHIYFSLLDPEATDRFGQRLLLPCAFFRGMNQHLKFKLTDGLKVLCLGQVTTYEGRAQYQLKVLQVQPKGKGALQLAFEQLQQRLQAEGLFDEARKRPIPRMPGRIGLVTSPSGSAVHDMVSQLRGYFHVVILPVRVQGEGAAADLVEAIGLANQRGLVDVLIVGRGGGSIEDLWAFNEEPVARAIARSRIPVISAVGHQDDWTIADYVADLRASTPTDAAKRLVHEQELLAEQGREEVERLVEAMRAWLDEQAQRLAAAGSQLRLLHPLKQLERSLDRVQALQAQGLQATRHALDRAERHLQGVLGRLSALSPLAVLARGYSITMRLPERHVVTEARALAAGDELETLLSRGRILSTVTGTTSIFPESANGK
ncbi:MAG: exodeoxyribonuclease VII large subunit [Candidatus Omnitrophica bacterium]|nr:exodeoxyribonuclease VII large subunit [Candidatus Omnitrophota bacterium]